MCAGDNCSCRSGGLDGQPRPWCVMQCLSPIASTYYHVFQISRSVFCGIAEDLTSRTIGDLFDIDRYCVLYRNSQYRGLSVHQEWSGYSSAKCHTTELYRILGERAIKEWELIYRMISLRRMGNRIIERESEIWLLKRSSGRMKNRLSRFASLVFSRFDYLGTWREIFPPWLNFGYLAIRFDDANPFPVGRRYVSDF